MNGHAAPAPSFDGLSVRFSVVDCVGIANWLTGCIGKALFRSALFRVSRCFTLATIVVWSAAGAVDGRTWNGGGTDDFWSTAGNWLGSEAPSAGDALFFDGITRRTAHNDMAADTAFGGITFNVGAGAFALSGNRLTLLDNVTSHAANDQTIQLDMILDAARTFQVASGGTVAVDGLLSGSEGLIKAGGGTLVLSRANAYDGTTHIQGGMVLLGDDASLGTDTIEFNHAGGIGSASGESRSLANPVDVKTSHVVTLGTASTGHLTISGNVRRFADTTFLVANTSTTLSGIVSGGGQYIVKSGPGTLVLAGANTYTGATALHNGQLLLDYAAADPVVNSGPGEMIVRGGTLTFRGAAAAGPTSDTVGNVRSVDVTRNTIRVENGATITTPRLTAGGNVAPLMIDLTGGGTFIAQNLSNISPSSGVLVQGPGGSQRANLYVQDDAGIGFATRDATSGHITRYTGAMTLDASASSNTTNYTMNADIARTGPLAFHTLAIDTTDQPVVLNMGTHALDPSGTGRGILVTGTHDATIAADSGRIANSVNIANYSSGTMTLDISLGGIAVVNNGPGLVVYTNTANPGDVYVANGVLRFTGEPRHYGSDVMRIFGDGVFEIGADLNEGEAQFTRAVGQVGHNRVALIGNGGFSAYGATRVVALGGQTGPVDLTWGTGSFLDNGAGLDNSYTFKLGSPWSDATLEFANPIDLNGRERVIEVADGVHRGNVDARLTGTLSGGPGSSLMKTGEGTLALSGANTYAGTTTVMAGTLLVDGTHTGGGRYDLAGGAMGGSGAIEGSVEVHAGSTYSPGASVGRQTIATKTWYGGGRFEFEINDAEGTAGQSPGWDLLTVSSATGIGTLDLSALSAADPFLIDIVSFDDSSPGDAANFDVNQYYTWEFVTYEQLAGAFDRDFFTLDATRFSNGLGFGRFELVETGGGLAIAFVVPEPGTLIMGMAGLVLLLWRRRR